MANDIIDLRSINWSQGMFLTPDHFLRQERYFDSALLWTARYATATTGLIGGGPRVSAADRGAASFDPVVDFDDNGEALKITVTECRGMTAAGGIVEVTASQQLTATFPKAQLEGVLEFGIYVVMQPHDKEPDDAIPDPINTDLQTGRRLRHWISLDPSAHEAPWSLMVTRLRRAEKGLRFERLRGYIPPCAYMSSHSELMYAFQQLNERVVAIADHYSALHRAVVHFVALARARQLNVEQDLETLGFVSRMVVTLEECAYRILDPFQPPKQFFQETNQLIRSAALFLSLSPPTRDYFRRLAQDIGERELTSLVEQDDRALEMSRRWTLADDLGAEAQRVNRALDRLDRLEQTLEGKYVDYRLNPSLESINFFFDTTSGDPVLYRSESRVARPQARDRDLTFVFAPLQLEARKNYRIVLVGERDAEFRPGEAVGAELRLNQGEGYNRPPEHLKSRYDIDQQRNVAIDFAAPHDISVIRDIRVSIQNSLQIRSAILYVRVRFGETEPAAVAPPPNIAPRPAPGPVRPAPAPRDPGQFRPQPIDNAYEGETSRSSDPAPPIAKRRRFSPIDSE